jgi:hypothetical protein
MKPGMQTFLDVSTAHLTPEDLQLLNDHKELLEDGITSLTGTSIIHYDMGYIVSTMSLTPGLEQDIIDAKIEDMKRDGFSDEFIALARYGASEGGLLLRFDADAPTLEAFPVFGETHTAKL